MNVDICNKQSRKQMNKKKNEQKKLQLILSLQLAVLLYSFSGIASKLASRYSFLSTGFIICYFFELVILGVYALIWQQIIKKTDISIAYTNKAVTIFWSMIWSVLFFKENISIANLVGVIVIFAGTVMVNKNV